MGSPLFGDGCSVLSDSARLPVARFESGGGEVFGGSFLVMVCWTRVCFLDLGGSRRG